MTVCAVSESDSIKDGEKLSKIPSSDVEELETAIPPTYSDNPRTDSSRLLFAILVLLRSLVSPQQFPNKTYQSFYPYPPITLIKYINESNGSYSEMVHQMSSLTLIYSPSPNEILDKSFDILRSKFKEIKGYKNSRMLEERLVEENSKNKETDTLAGVQFDDNLYNKKTIPNKDVEVVLRCVSYKTIYEISLLVISRFPAELQRDRVQFYINEADRLIDHKGVCSTWCTRTQTQLFLTGGPRHVESRTGGIPSK